MPAADSSPTTPARTEPAERTSPGQWVAVAMVTLSTFLVVTSEMLPVGVLTPMADGLGISSGVAGSSLTITGLVAAVTAPVVPRLLGDADRRHVLAVAVLALTAGNVLTAVSTGFGMLVASRTVLGLGMGTVWGLAAAVAARLVAPRNAALAVSFAVSGVASASVFGVPLGTLIGNAFGWRAAFATLAGLGVLLAAGLLAALPRLRRPPVTEAGDEAPRRSLARPAVVLGLLVVVFLVTAHFAAYTYVRPALEQLPRLAPDAVALLLLIYGVFGLAGNFLAGAAAARRARATVLALAAGIAAAIAALAFFGSGALAAGLAIALWGIAYGGLSVGGQLWMTQAAPDRVEHVTGIYVGFFTAAIAAGAFLGGVVIETAGIVTLLWATAGLAALSLVIGLATRGPRATAAG
ncbi:MFS transporter [Amycolatopsis granulosa]|uniref:MFS transporter n=1 Tax=Amycolatopsis granulosa TaxID=185684 RepID=UPI001FB957B6|nr:MFS transporter [Amycolatopsis granulosa]NIH87119.1 putative MFS family arabinose efflux permease [Amycolatopsis granulosa]